MALTEEWRPVSGFAGLYQVSSLGQVRRDPACGFEYLLQAKVPDEPRRYAAISFRNNGFRKRRYVHHVVAEAFLPPRPSPEHELRHLDGDRANNAASNLAWGTRQDNANDRAAHGRTAVGERHGMFGKRLSGEANGFAKLSDAAARQVHEMAVAGESQRSIATAVGVSQKTVWRVLSGNGWAHIALRARAATEQPK